MGIDPINSEPFLLIYNERGVMGMPGMSITPKINYYYKLKDCII
jgi:hypothetical protein